MSLRTNVTDVKKIITTGLEQNDIQFLIEVANRMVTDTLSGQGLSSGKLKDIECFLTAHLIEISKERRPEEEDIGELRMKFAKQPEGFLNQTLYGQFVLNLDTTGKFQGNMLKKAKFNTIAQTYDGGNSE